MKGKLSLRVTILDEVEVRLQLDVGRHRVDRKSGCCGNFFSNGTHSSTLLIASVKIEAASSKYSVESGSWKA